ncbi:MAG: hypothetical protein SPJ08_02115 [Sphaerochaetaceae bacterium]|nr:hypothetical protein [Sphaerochaetaceae bacterium]
MKKIFSFCVVSIFALALFASEGQMTLLRWQLRVPKSTSVIRYQLNGEEADKWTVTHNTADGIIELPVETPVGEDSVIYVQQSKDGVLWSESLVKYITADVVQQIYEKNNVQIADIEFDSNAPFDTAVTDENADIIADTESVDNVLSDTVVTDENEDIKGHSVDSSSSASSFAFSFLVKPSVSINLQKILPVADNEHWKNYAAGYNWKTTNKFGAKDLAPRLDFEFGFQNIGGKKGDVAAFDIALNLGYETAPYSGWTDESALKNIMSLDSWYHNASLDLRLDLAINAGVFRPYIGVGAGVMLSFVNARKTSDNLPGTPLFVLRNGLAHPDSMTINGYTYVLGAIGFRFNCTPSFTIGIDGTYKLFVTGANTDRLWHSVDCALSLGGTWSI